VSKSRLRKLKPSLIADRTALLLRSAHDKAILRLQRWVRGWQWRKRFNDLLKRKIASAVLIQCWYRYHKSRKGNQLALQFRLNKLKTRGLKAWRTTFTAQLRLRTAAMSQLQQWTWFQAHFACMHADFQAIRPLQGVFEMANQWREWRKAARCVTLWKLVSAQR
jgi:hypothetical protein